jgi:carbamoyltransferase
MDDGSIVLNTDYFDFMTGSRMINDRFCSLFGGPAKLPEAEMTVREMDIARSIQEVTEEIILKMVGHAVKLAGSRNLCMAGGVALNCVANGKILRSGLIDRLWVQPAAGDAGGALGAALLCAYEHFKVDRVVASEGDSQKGSLLGPSFKKDEIKRVLDAYGFIYRHLETDRLHVLAAALLAEGKVVGLFQGRMEYGPRALGGRSILGDPRVADMQRKMNLKIKFRESFRPFAPVVLSEKAHQWFDLKQESPYMLLTADVKADHRKSLSVEEESLKGKEKLDVRRSDITAVTHVDYSARVQTLSKDSGGIMRGILEAFDELTGCPVLINTSFNVRGEPIVYTPFDALRCFMNTDIDALVLENFVLIKEEQGGVLVEKDFKGAFEPD